MPWLYGWPMLDAVVVLCLLSLLIEVDEGKIKFPKRSPQIYMLGGLWLAAMLSHVPHTYFVGMTDAMVEVFKICFFTLLLYCSLDTPKKMRAISRLFVATACIMAVHALLQEVRGYGYAGSRPLWVPPYGDRPAEVRSCFFGIFADPNDLAQAFATAIPLSFTMTRRKNALSVISGVAISAFLFRAYLSTGSRGGMVAMVAIGGVMICLMLPRRWMRYVMAGGLLAALVFCRLKGGAMLDASARERVVFWGFGNQAFKANPLFGVGYNMFWSIAKGRAAHNAFVTCYAELGILGYWMWFGVFFLGILLTWRVRMACWQKRSLEEAYLYRFSGLGLAAMGGFAASAYFLSRTFVYPFFFLIAMLNATPRLAENVMGDETPAFLNPRRDVGWYVTLATFGSILYIYISIIFLNQAYGG